MYQLQVSNQQLDYIKNACEYLGRHLIGQPSFIPPELEERTEDKHKIGQTILDMRKVIMHEYYKHETGANVHQYDVYKMGQEPLMEIYPITIKEGQ